MRAAPPRSFDPARATGAYLLLLRVHQNRTLDVGGLGRVPFPKGNYVYIGSGMGGLEARVARHFRSARRLRPNGKRQLSSLSKGKFACAFDMNKKVKWHIDRLLAGAELVGAVLFQSKERKECELARSCLSFPGAGAVRGFGSSDCRCPGHLVYLGALPFGALLKSMDRGRTR